MARHYLGKFEEIVLLAVHSLNDNAYGITIQQRISEVFSPMGEKAVSIGALYTTLSRMHDKQWLSRKLGPPTSRRGGRARLYYSLTELGMTKLVEAKKARELLVGFQV